MINDDTIDKQYVRSTLKRLSFYYADRARIAFKQARDAPDVDAMTFMAIPAIRWQAKQDAVHKVAENLDIILDASENSATPGAPVYTTDNREMFIVQFLTDALEIEGARHKQYFLCKLAEVLGLKEILDDVDDRGVTP